MLKIGRDRNEYISGDRVGSAITGGLDRIRPDRRHLSCKKSRNQSDTNSKYGWEIDPICIVAEGEGDKISERP